MLNTIRYDETVSLFEPMNFLCSILVGTEAAAEAGHLSLTSHCLKPEGAQVSVCPISDSAVTFSIT